MRGKAWVYFATVALSACATNYQPNGFTGGFSETQVDENVFLISFRGNGFTSAERASELVLLRAAELTSKHGYSYFVIADFANTASQYTHRTPTTYNTTSQPTAYGNTAFGQSTTIAKGGDTYNVAKPRASRTVVFYKDKPEGQGLVYSSNFILESLGAKYGLPKAQQEKP